MLQQKHSGNLDSNGKDLLNDAGKSASKIKKALNKLNEAE